MRQSIFITATLFCVFGTAYAENTELQKRLTDLKAKGEPTTATDLTPAAIDPKDNAHEEIKAAAKAMKNETPEYDAIDNRDEIARLPLTPFEEEKLGVISEQNRECFDLLAKAAAKPQAIADVKWGSPAIMILLPTLNDDRALANLLAYECFNQMALGNFDQAITRCGQMEILAKYAESNRVLVGVLVATGIRAKEAATVVQIAPALNIGDNAGASRDAVTKYIARLLDHDGIIESFSQSISAERACTLDTMQSMLNGKLTPEQMKQAFGKESPKLANPQASILEMNQVYVIDYFSNLLTHAAAADFPAAEKLMKAAGQENDLNAKKKDPNYIMVATILPSMNRAVQTKYAVMTRREGAAAALAVRLYAIDHNGSLPEKLDDLVPKYLLRLPRDYMADNQPLKYRAGDKAVLWSVGRDGVDNNAAEPVNNSSKGDDVFPLTIPPRDVAAQ